MSLMAREEKAQNPGGPDLENYHCFAGNGQGLPPTERRRRAHRTACSPSQALVWLSSRDVVPSGCNSQMDITDVWTKRRTFDQNVSSR